MDLWYNMVSFYDESIRGYDESKRLGWNTLKRSLVAKPSMQEFQEAREKGSLS